jgi:hypothetical protein
VTIVLLILALAVLAGVLSGGSARYLSHLQVHWWGLAPIALVLQSAQIPVGSAERSGLAAAALVSSYVLLLAVVAVNRRVPGAALMAAGLTMNLAVVALNGGMPVERDAIRAAGANGVIVIEDGAKHHLMSNADVLRPLADVLRLHRGVCQDFAHLATGCLRSMGLAARYASGVQRLNPVYFWGLCDTRVDQGVDGRTMLHAEIIRAEVRVFEQHLEFQYL